MTEATAEAPSVAEEKKTRKRLTPEEKIAKKMREIDDQKSLLAIRTLKGTKSGKKLLTAVNALRFVARNTPADSDPIGPIAEEVLEILTKKLAKQYGIDPADLVRNDDPTAPLPFEG